MMDQNPEVQEDLGTGGKIKNWLQDNIRIILSVLIVLAIAGGIYSYSQRNPELAEDEIALEETGDQLDQNQETKDQAVTILGEEDKQDQDKKTSEQQAQPKQEEQKIEENKQPAQQQQQKDDVKVETKDQEQSVSEETGEAFSETAVSGDSVTTLARKALRDYLEKNNDSSLTSEHKIYIEDYLRRQIAHNGKLQVGEKVSFSKVLIKDSIEKSKTLNANQLDNLKHYSQQVSTL